MKWMSVLFPIDAVNRAISLAFQTFEQIVHASGVSGLFKVLLGLIVFWHLYVPLHEMLHVAGCFLVGGEVTSLSLKPQYGGVILNKFFSFVVPESEYAGRLSGFTTPGAWGYAVVDFFPYSISLFGVSLVMFCQKRTSAFLLGPALILTFVPFMSIPGDYYEAVSLVTTRVASALNPGLGVDVLVSDDVFRSIHQLWNSGKLDWTIGILIFFGIMLAVYLAFMTLALQVWVCSIFYRTNRPKYNKRDAMSPG